MEGIRRICRRARMDKGGQAGVKAGTELAAYNQHDDLAPHALAFGLSLALGLGLSQIQMLAPQRADIKSKPPSGRPTRTKIKQQTQTRRFVWRAKNTTNAVSVGPNKPTTVWPSSHRL